MADRAEPPEGSMVRQQQQPAAPAIGAASRPLHRNGIFDNAKLEEVFRRRVERLAQRPPSRLSRQLQALNYTLMLGVGTYMVLYQDYGDRPHCFSGLRRWYFSKINSVWTLSREEEEELRGRAQRR